MDLDINKQKCLESLSLAFEELNIAAQSSQLESIAELIIQSMTGPWRFFHTPEHIFQVGQGGDAIEVISALFHDMVYVQVDQGVNVNIARHIAPFIKEVNQQLFITDNTDLLDDPLFKLTFLTFGFELGKPLQPMAGQNEFLSALLAAKVLDGLLPLPILAQIVACIEATIPFRGPDANGESCSHQLFKRLQMVNQTFQFVWQDDEIHKMVERCVRLCNRDVENFASQNPAHFLDNTWNLIPETNHDLMRVNTYTAQGYRISLQKMDGFLGFLKAEIVFRQYQNEPSSADFDALIAMASRNLEIARLYLGMKLTSIAFLEAISTRIGRNVSVAMLMGEMPSDKQVTLGLEQYLPEITHPICPEAALEQEVMSLLELGRTVNSEYDVKNSPVATFMVKTVGFDEMKKLLALSRQYFKGEISAENLIEAYPKALAGSITESISKLFDQRKSALMSSV
jgi:hypothetical protein